MVLVEAGRYCSMRPLLCQGKVYGGCRAGHFIDVLRAGRWATVIVVALALAWPVGAAPTPLPQASPGIGVGAARSEEHTSELQSRGHLVCRLLLEKKKKKEEVVVDT